MKESLNFNKSE